MPELGPAPFIALLIADNVAFDAWRDSVCAHLARSGCRYFVAWGQDCGLWAHAMDVTAGSLFGRGGGDTLILTAAHEEAPLAEAMWASVHDTSHPAVALTGLVIVHVTPRPRREEILAQYSSAALREKPGI